MVSDGSRGEHRAWPAGKVVVVRRILAFSGLVLTVLTVGACQQVFGISDATQIPGGAGGGGGADGGVTHRGGSGGTHQDAGKTSTHRDAAADAREEDAKADAGHHDAAREDAAGDASEPGNAGDAGDGGHPADAGDGGQSQDAGDAGQDAGPKVCSPTTCPSGCCGTDGLCHTDESKTTCGTGGISCVICGTADTCTAGECVPKCNSANCASGCCDAIGTCITATSDTACGTNGAACGPCMGSNHCVSGACGCTSTTDCPAFQACNSGHCTGACSGAVPCNGGCCNPSNNQCTPGNTGPSCGTGGAMCSVCTGATTGTACISSTSACGCNSYADCPSEYACNASHVCTKNCSNGVNGVPCNGGCCDGTTCQAGNTNSLCGGSTSACQTCPEYETCQNQACVVTACADGGACTNGGCCVDGKCQAGAAAAGCGPTCANCTNANQTAGYACLSSTKCGCNSFADCPPNYACVSNQCAQTSCDGVTTLCNQGCCNGGTCVVGTSLYACGYNGMQCVDVHLFSHWTSCEVLDGGGTPFATTGGSGVSCPGTECAGLVCPTVDGGAPEGAAAIVVQEQYGACDCFCGCNSSTDCPSLSMPCVDNLCLQP